MEIVNISKIYGEKTALAPISHVFEDGKLHLIMGASGSGKTTLLKIIAGLLTPDSGEIIPPISDKIGFVFQEDRLCESLDAVRNIAIVSSKNITKSVIEDHLEQAGISKEARSQPVSQFSGGMKRRVAIVRAVLCGASLLLMDEPLKGLDQKTRNAAADYIIRNCVGKTVLMVTHEPEDEAIFHAPVLHLSK